MTRSFRFLAALLFLVPISYTAAQTPKDIASELENKTVLLRGCYSQNKLAFDAQGNLSGDATPAPFSLSAIAIHKVSLSDHSLTIHARRGLLISTIDTNPPSVSNIHVLPLREEITLTIAFDPAHPETLQNAAHKIFAANVEDALSAQTSTQRELSLYTLAALGPMAEPQPARPSPTSDTNSGVFRRENGLILARVIHYVDPEFSTEAKQKRIGGICLVMLVVDENGFPSHIRIERSLDAQLDQNAIASVSQYRFAPAVFNSKPVSSMVLIEVNFRVS